jgi:hypothetical protein
VEEKTTEVLDMDLTGPVKIARRQLLPWWIKTFCWIFMVFGALAIAGIGLGLFKITFDLSLYGLSTTDPLSLIGLSLIAIFIFKGIASFGLWTEKDWAVDVAIADAVIGIVVCVFMMLIYPVIDDLPGFKFNFRLELVLLILYLLKLQTIRSPWKASEHTVRI